MQYTTTVSSFVFPGVHRQLRGRRERICVRGTSGPPIVVSSGLFSLMPSLTYSKFFQALQDQNLTLITTDSIRPMTRELFEDIAHTLNVNAVGFLAHSSFDKTILCSPALHAAVLCDPVVLPDNFELRQPHRARERHERLASQGGAVVYGRRRRQRSHDHNNIGRRRRRL